MSTQLRFLYLLALTLIIDCRTYSVKTTVLISLILWKSTVRQHATVDLVVKQVVLGQLDEELSLRQGIGGRCCLPLRLLVIRDKVRLRDLVGSLQEIDGVSPEVDRAAVDVTIKGHRLSCLVSDCVFQSRFRHI